MAATHDRSRRALLEERLTTAQRLLGQGRDRDGMHWLWAAAAGLDRDRDQVRAVLAVAKDTRSTSRGNRVRSDCGALIARLETQFRTLGVADDTPVTVPRSDDGYGEPSAACGTPRLARATAYYLDERLSLAEGTGRFPANGGVRETVEEGFFVIAIRKSGSRECLFRFPDRDRADAQLMLASLNRSAARAAS